MRILDTMDFGVGVKFYQRSQYKYYYRSDYKVRHKMCKPISRHGPTSNIGTFSSSVFVCDFLSLLVISRGQEPRNVLDYQNHAILNIKVKL